MKMLPSSVEEGVGGGADYDLMFSASGDNHPGARRATPPESGGESFSSFVASKRSCASGWLDRWMNEVSRSPNLSQSQLKGSATAPSKWVFELIRLPYHGCDHPANLTMCSILDRHTFSW